MALKIEQTESQVKDLEFPKLMIASSGTIILALCLEKGFLVGTCISSPSKFNGLGEYSTGWDPDAFVDYTGTLKLSNDTSS